jgi:hypothetical protein
MNYNAINEKSIFCIYQLNWKYFYNKLLMKTAMYRKGFTVFHLDETCLYLYIYLCVYIFTLVYDYVSTEIVK